MNSRKGFRSRTHARQSSISREHRKDLNILSILRVIRSDPDSHSPTQSGQDFVTSAVDTERIGASIGNDRDNASYIYMTTQNTCTASSHSHHSAILSHPTASGVNDRFQNARPAYSRSTMHRRASTFSHGHHEESQPPAHHEISQPMPFSHSMRGSNGPDWAYFHETSSPYPPLQMSQSEHPIAYHSSGAGPPNQIQLPVYGVPQPAYTPFHPYPPVEGQAPSSFSGMGTHLSPTNSAWQSYEGHAQMRPQQYRPQRSHHYMPNGLRPERRLLYSPTPPSIVTPSNSTIPPPSLAPTEPRTISTAPASLAIPYQCRHIDDDGRRCRFVPERKDPRKTASALKVHERIHLPETERKRLCEICGNYRDARGDNFTTHQKGCRKRHM